MAKDDKAVMPASTTSNTGLTVATPEALAKYAFVNQHALEVVKQNLGGQHMSASDFEKIKFPSGGAQSWEIVNLQGDIVSVKSIDGIVLMHRTQRAYWATEFSGGNTPPDCASKDLINGMGNPGGLCATCPYSQWESDPKGSGGQACKIAGSLFVMRPSELLPVVVPVPVASVAPLKKFMLSLASNELLYSNVILSIGLEQTQNKKGIKFSKIKPRLIAVLPEEAKAQINKYIAEFRSAMEAVQVEREDVTES